MLYKTIFLKYIFITLWFGLLVFPFMGVKGGVLLAIAIFAGGMIFLGLARIEAIGRIKNALAGISIPGLLPGKKGAPVKNRNILVWKSRPMHSKCGLWPQSLQGRGI